MHYPQLLTIMIIAGVIAITGCTNHQDIEPEKKVEQKKYNKGPDENISTVLYRLDSAIADVLTFRSLSCKKEPDSMRVRAFTIRAIDFLGALGIPARYVDSTEFKHARVYLGYREHVGFKLFIVPVIDAHLSSPEPRPGIDIFFDRDGNTFPPNTEPNPREMYVLDLNAPCPKTCAVSPLNPEEKK